MKKIYLITIFIVLLLLFTGWFYWYQLRPMEIRKYCYNQTFGKIKNKVEENKKGNYDWAPGKDWHALEEGDEYSGKWGWKYTIPDPNTLEYLFALCLNSRGIETSFPNRGKKAFIEAYTSELGIR